MLTAVDRTTLGSLMPERGILNWYEGEMTTVKVTGKTFDMRVYDVTNSEVIAELTGIASVESMAIFTLTPLANVTAGEAVWELQLRRPSGQPNKVEALVGFLQVEFE